MKTKLLFGLSTAFILMGLSHKAQVSNYTFSQTPGSYGAPSTGTLVGNQLQDDDVSTVPLGFNFMYNGSNYNSINVCTNGYLSFANITGTEYSPLSDFLTTQVIAPFGQDLFLGTAITADMTMGSNILTNCSSVNGFSVGDVIFDYGFDFGGVNPTVTAVGVNNLVLNTAAINSNSGYDVFNFNGRIRQSVSGTTPNRVCEFEFRNMTRYSIYDEVINFKVKFFETSNRIEFIYGAMIPGADQTPSEVGLKGNNNSDFNSREVTTLMTWNASTAASLISDNCDFTASNYPTTGQIYMWTPPNCTVPVLGITQSNANSCEGTSVTLTADGAQTYSWSTGSSLAQIVVSPSTSTTYTLVGFNGSCSSTVTVTQNVLPAPAVTLSASKNPICVGEEATLTASGANSYSWNTGANSASITVSPSITTTYTVSGSDGTCQKVKSIELSVDPCTSINENTLAEHTLKAYPNPFNGELTIENTNDKLLKVQMVNILGRTVYSGSIESSEKQSISTTDLAAGIYFISFTTQGGKITKKLIKE
jgi:hypothetical protein